MKHQTLAMAADKARVWNGFVAASRALISECHERRSSMGGAVLGDLAALSEGRQRAPADRAGAQCCAFTVPLHWFKLANKPSRKRCTTVLNCAATRASTTASPSEAHWASMAAIAASNASRADGIGAEQTRLMTRRRYSQVTDCSTRSKIASHTGTNSACILLIGPKWFLFVLNMIAA